MSPTGIDDWTMHITPAEGILLGVAATAAWNVGKSWLDHRYERERTRESKLADKRFELYEQIIADTNYRAERRTWFMRTPFEDEPEPKNPLEDVAGTLDAKGAMIASKRLQRLAIDQMDTDHAFYQACSRWQQALLAHKKSTGEARAQLQKDVGANRDLRDQRMSAARKVDEDLVAAIRQELGVDASVK